MRYRTNAHAALGWRAANMIEPITPVMQPVHSRKSVGEIGICIGGEFDVTRKDLTTDFGGQSHLMLA